MAKQPATRETQRAVEQGSASEGHPAPERARVGLAALWFGLFGAPVAWAIQTLVNLPLAAHACFPALEPLSTPVVGGLRGMVFGVSLVVLVVAALATAVAWRSWSRTREEHQASSGSGARHDQSTAALETGEDRTRFMALAGLMMSGTFLFVSAAHLATVFIVHPCGI
jgi:hypothetical protein